MSTIKVTAIKCDGCTFEATIDENIGGFTAKVTQVPQKVVIWSFPTGRLSEARLLAENACRSIASNFSGNV